MFAKPSSFFEDSPMLLFHLAEIVIKRTRDLLLRQLKIAFQLGLG